MANLQWSRIRRQYMAKSAAAFAASLIITVILAFIIGNMPAQIAPAGPNGYTATLFANYAALGYVVVALLAFCLGALVTIFCFRMRKHMEVMQDDRKL